MIDRRRFQPFDAAVWRMVNLLGRRQKTVPEGIFDDRSAPFSVWLTIRIEDARLSSAEVSAHPGRPTLPLNQIRVGMNAVQVAQVLERCGWSNYLKPGRAPADADFDLFVVPAAGIHSVGNRIDTLVYQRADGETLTIRWEGPAGPLEVWMALPALSRELPRQTG